MEVSPLAAPVADLAGEDEQRSAVGRGARDGAMRRLLAGSDLIAVLLALVFALTVPSSPAWGHEFLPSLVALPLMIVLFKLYGLYDRDVKRISQSTVDDLPLILHATIVGGLLLWLISRGTPIRRLDLLEVVSFGLVMLVAAPFGRTCVRRSAGCLIGRDRALMVGSGVSARTLVAKLAAHPEYQLEVIGSLIPAGDLADPAQTAAPALGGLEQLEDIAADRGVSRVVIAQELEGEELERLLRRCRALSLKVSVLPKLADLLGPAVEIDDVEGLTVLGVNPPWLPRSSRAVKRAIDLVTAGGLLLFSSPLLLVVALGVKLSSSGPVLFAQERVGRGGRRFCLYKFRTMVADAEDQRTALLAQSQDANWLHLEHDPRITRIGRHLRLLSLDELPQLWNVVRGEMSMVGPRPLIPSEDERVTGWARGRLDLTPGITGYWQVLGRTRIPFEEMVKLDYLYVMNWSLWEDVRLMLRTLPVVMARRGAN